MLDFSLTKSEILGFLCVTLAAVLASAWNIGTRIEEVRTAQAAKNLEQLIVPISLRSGLAAEEYSRITNVISAIPKVRSATWRLNIPQWSGPSEASKEWESLWRSRLPAGVSIRLATNLEDFPSLPTLVARIRSVSGVIEVRTPESEWASVRSLYRSAYTIGWLARVTGAVGGAMLAALVLLMMTSVGHWPQGISSRFVRLATTIAGGLWAVVVTVWLGNILTPVELTNQSIHFVFLCCLIGIVIPNLLLPRGLEPRSRSSPHKGARERRYETTKTAHR